MYSLDGVALANKDYVAEQYRRYQADPASVDERWAAFFAGFELASDNGEVPATLIEAAGPAPVRVPDASDLVHSFRELGHLVAHLNPLEPRPMGHPLLDPAEFGFTADDMERVVECGGFQGLRRAPLGELIERRRRTYCGTLGVEYLHIPDKEQREWLQERMEPTENRPELAAEDRVRVLEDLLQDEVFEQFLQVRYPTAKRFSLEGSESLIPMLDTLIEEAGALGVEEMVFGMPHRGRLNVLANVIRKPYEMILAEFEGALLAREATGDGDVKYHLGYSRDHTTRASHKVHLSLSANPSHLEAIDPVIEGMVRAKQDRYGDRERSRVVPVLLHGDAAFNGQGVVTEILGLSELPGYHVGGTIHIIVDNQIAFTTPPGAYRFTRYPSDVTKIIQAPVFHVNGHDPEAAVQPAGLGLGLRGRGPAGSRCRVSTPAPRLHTAPARGASDGGARPDGGAGNPHRLGLRGGAGDRLAPARGNSRPHERAGHQPWHVQPTPCRAARRGERYPVRPTRPHPPGTGPVHDPRQHAVRIRRARLRVRHEPRRSAPARRLGGAVR